MIPRPLRVLYIEDNAADAELAIAELESAGFEVLVDVVDSREGFCLALEHSTYDVVLADYRLHRWRGTEGLDELQQRALDMPFILVTGALGEEAAVDIIKQGATDYVLKDRLARLPVAVERALEEKSLREERARAAAALNDSEKRFRALIENGSDGIVLIGPDGTLLYSSPAAHNLLGYSANEFLGRSVCELVHPQDLADAQRSFNRLLQEPGTPVACQIRCRHSDGSWRWLEGIGNNLLAAAPVQAVVVNYRDITDRKAAEEEIRRLNENLEKRVAERTGQLKAANEELAREVQDRRWAEEALGRLQYQQERILNSAGDGIFCMDRTGLVTFANPAAARLTGWSVEELLGQNLHEAIHHSKPDGRPYPEEECPIGCMQRDGAARTVADDVFWRKDGTSFPVEYVSMPLLENAEAVGAVVTFRDVSEQRLVQQMKDDFISMVSHELRTPLTSIHGALRLLTSKGLEADPSASRELLGIAVRNSERLVRLTNDILDVERLGSGEVRLSRQPCRAEALVKQAVQEMRAMADEAGVRLVDTSGPVPFSGDPDRLVQTLTNLLSNAVKFSSAGSTVSVSAERRGGEVLFEVRDRGRGIPADRLESIFGRFQQVDASDSRRKGGTGLGLWICRRIVEMHGGKIWAESVMGEGSTFRFTLPTRTDSAEAGDA